MQAHSTIRRRRWPLLPVVIAALGPAPKGRGPVSATAIASPRLGTSDLRPDEGLESAFVAGVRRGRDRTAAPGPRLRRAA